MPQAETLARHFHLNSPLLRNACAIAATRGGSEPEPATFRLAPDHRVQVDRTGITIDYRGERVTKNAWAGAGWRFLPTRLTEIGTGSAAEPQRYFLETFAWIPTTPVEQPLWMLSWFASEVVGTELLAIPGDGVIARFTGAVPPDTFRIDDVPRLVVSDGQISRVVTGELASSVTVPPRRMP